MSFYETAMNLFFSTVRNRRKTKEIKHPIFISKKKLSKRRKEEIMLAQRGG
jgi:hypothetical protein